MEIRNSPTLQFWGIFLLTISGVYLGFRYLLPLILPFVISYFLVRSLLPVVNFLHQKFHAPKVATGICLLVLFLSLLVIAGSYLVCLAWKQFTRLAGNYQLYLDLFCQRLDGACCAFDRSMHLKTGTSQAFLQTRWDGMSRKLNENLLSIGAVKTYRALIFSFEFIFTFFIVLTATILLFKDLDTMKKYYESSPFYEKIHAVLLRLSGAGLAYLKTQVIIISIISTFNTLGLLLIKNPYALLFGIIIALIDAFPALGSGLVLVPWAIYEIAAGNPFNSTILIILYIICVFIREFLEARLMGKRIGLLPIIFLAAVYIGLKLFGILGVVLGPISFILVQAILAEFLPHREPPADS